MSAFRNIVVAVDFSSHAQRALDRAIELAVPLGARLHLVHSYMEVPAHLLERNIWIADDVWDRIRDEDGKRLEALRARAAEKGIEVQVHQSPHPPREAIAERAAALDADLIVMGTRGHSGLKHMLLGSVAEQTLRSARCPVMVVPAASTDAG